MAIIGKTGLTAEDFYSVLFEGERVEVGADVINTVNNSHKFLLEFSNNKLIYCINTGFGPMAQYVISKEVFDTCGIK